VHRSRPQAVSTSPASIASSSASGSIGGTSRVQPLAHPQPEQQPLLGALVVVELLAAGDRASAGLDRVEVASVDRVVHQRRPGEVAVRADPDAEVVAVPPVQQVVAAALGGPSAQFETS
jgi:hypothetical protein